MGTLQTPHPGVVIFTEDVTIESYCWEQTGDGLGHRKVTTGAVVATVKLTVDLAGLVKEMGYKAARARGRKSRDCNGLIQCVTVGFRNTETPP